MKQYIIDAFTDKVFSGNPAAVCVMDKWPEETWMMQLAAENNLSETAFIVKEKAGYHLRWFTPGTDAMEAAFGCRPIKAILGLDLICVFENAEIVQNMNPDPSLLMKIEGRIQNATAKGKNTDCVSRSFCPKLAITEDPVCGSAHCQIADYWPKELNKDNVIAYQASKRGGTLHCHITGNGRIKISGKAVLGSVK